MAKLRNVTGEALRVPFLAELTGRELVEADEVVEVPDRLIAHDEDGVLVGYAWPETLWQVVDDKPAAKPAAKAKGEAV